jgi:hypothetical protein
MRFLAQGKHTVHADATHAKSKGEGAVTANYEGDALDDYPRRQLPNVPYWSESFAYWAYSAENDFDLYVHYQRQVADPGIWKGMMVLMMSNGDAFVAKSFGRQADPTGPGPMGMYGKCLEAGKSHWFQFDGAAQRVKQADMWKGVLTDGIVEPLFIEVEFDALCPLWQLNPDDLKKHEAEVMHMHYEQPYRTHGLLRFGGTSRQFTGVGYRDHSYGPRNFTKMGDGQLLYGIFPSNRAYWFFTVRAQDGTYLCREGGMAVDGKLHPIEIVDTPLHMPLILGEQSSIDYTFRSVLGESTVRVTYTGRGMPFTLTPPAEEIIGTVGGFDKVPRAYWEANTNSEWDGEIGLGSAQGGIWR